MGIKYVNNVEQKKDWDEINNVMTKNFHEAPIKYLIKREI